MVSITADVVVVPLAGEDDAHDTCMTLREYLDTETTVVVVHVIEKAGGAPDKASVEQLEERAEKIFTIARHHLDGSGLDVESDVLYGTDVADTILEAVADADADLVAFSPREASRLARLLTGNVAMDLITSTDRPTLVVPTDGSEE